MKKNIIGALALTVMAQAAFAEKNAHTGFGMGLQGGYISHSGNLDTNTQFIPDENTSTTISGNGGTLGAFVDYGMMFRNFYTGLEIFGQYQDAKGQQHNHLQAGVTLKADIRMKESYGAALKFGGFMCKDLLAYLKAGVVDTKFEIATDTAGIPADKKRYNKTGFLTGAGFMIPIKIGTLKHLSLGAEWTYTWYKSFTYQYNRTDSYSHTYKPRVNNINVRLKYSF